MKKMACNPDNLTLDDYSLASVELSDSEKCHVALLAVEARRQSQLLYALHALGAHLMAKTV